MGMKPPGSPPRSMYIRIDELVLRGFKGADRFRIGEALQQELTRLLQAGGRPQTQRIVIRLSAQTSPVAVGTALGRSVYARLAPTLAGTKGSRSR